MRRALKYVALTVLAVAVVYGGSRLIRKVSFFQVRRVELVGARYLTPAVVAKAMSVPKGTSVFDGTAALRKKVLQLPGVLDASISRRPPGTLRVTVREAEPVALAERSGKMVLLDQGGRVLPFDPTHPAVDLPIAEVDASVTGLLARIRETDPDLFARVERGGLIRKDVVLDIPGGRMWFRAGASSDDIRNVGLVADYLQRQGKRWKELDARFIPRVVVRGAGA